MIVARYLTDTWRTAACMQLINRDAFHSSTIGRYLDLILAIKSEIRENIDLFKSGVFSLMQAAVLVQLQHQQCRCRQANWQNGVLRRQWSTTSELLCDLAWSGYIAPIASCRPASASCARQRFVSIRGNGGFTRRRALQQRTATRVRARSTPTPQSAPLPTCCCTAVVSFQLLILFVLLLEICWTRFASCAGGSGTWLLMRTCMIFII